MATTGRASFSPTGSNAQTRGWMSTVEARLEAMETQQRLFSSSVKGGAVVVYDDNLKQVGRLGVGNYFIPGGIRTSPTLAFSHSNSPAFHLLLDFEDGWVVPNWYHHFVQDTFVPVTNPDFVSIWKSKLTIHGYALQLESLLTADGATTGSIQLELGGFVISDTQTIAGGEQKLIRWMWDLSGTGINLSEGHNLRIMVRRDSGSGNINCYAPEGVYTVSLPSRNDTATPGGIPLI